MYGVELYAAVRLAVVDEGLSHHEAGRRFGIDRRTVKKMLSYSAPPGYRRTKPVRRPKLDGVTGIVDAILEADTDPEVPRKQPGTHMSEVDTAWRTARARARLDDVRIHDLHYSFLSRTQALGESLPMVEQLPSRSDGDATARYAHLAGNSIREAMERITDSIAADTVRELLTVRASARILSGSIFYGELEIERGGTVTGTVRPLPEDAV